MTNSLKCPTCGGGTILDIDPGVATIAYCPKCKKVVKRWLVS